MNQPDPHTLRVLEWDALTTRVAACAATPWGVEALRALQPAAEPRVHRELLADSAELLDLVRFGDPFPIRRVEAIESLLDEAAVLGAHLDGQQLLLIADFFALVSDLSRFANRCQGRYPRLKNRLDALQTADLFRHTVEASFEPDGTLKDSASPRLKELRRAIQKLQSSILEKLQREAARLGGDSVVTQREGRYVVSVGEQDRAKVRGIVHDRSQSGATFFIEPLTTLDAGNDLRSAIVEERNEVLAILAAITAQLRDAIPAARRNLSLISEIDSAWGKARWAARHGANPPQLSGTPDLKLVGARHPLLLAQEIDAQKSLDAARAAVIPFNLDLHDALRAIVVSGPNTGGKTVGLKTVGLTVLMIQAGIPPTLEANSIIGSFDGVYADIGDEQSLALSLSTFSAHLKQVGFACGAASERSLLLFDELGVGTDPEEGSALARAVITTLVERGSRVLVTTHYSSLKILTEQDSRIANAAFLFDEENLSPTYQLVIGRPGASYALDIARRLGFPSGIVQRAEQGVGRQAKELANLLARLAEQELQLREREQNAKQEQARLEALIAFNQTEQEKWKRISKHAEREAHRQVKLIVDEARRETERMVAQIRQTHASADSVKDAHRAFDRLAHKSEPRHDRPTVSEPFALTQGKRVHVRDINADGEITQIMPDGERVQVLIGSMHYTVHRSELAPAAASDVREPRPVSKVKAPPLELKSYEIDLRGRTAEEAQIELDEIFEAALQQGMKELRIIHGRGTGALRQKLTQWFRQHPRIESFRLGGIGEGGDGVSIVALKQS